MNTHELRPALARSLTPSGMSIAPSPEIEQSIGEPIDSTRDALPVRPRRRLGVVVAAVVAAAGAVILVAAAGRILDAQASDSVRAVAATLEVLEYEPTISVELAEAPEAKPEEAPEAKPSKAPPEPPTETPPEGGPTKKPIPSKSTLVVPPTSTKPAAPPAPPKSAGPAKPKTLKTW